jgi:D-alanyl-D-alanine carboxypeptidase
LIKKLSIVIALLFVLSIRCEAISARSYALVEQETGRLLAGENVTSRLPMASTTKIMTGFLACESGRLDEPFTVPGEALLVEGSSMGLVAGERLTLRELVYGLMLESGNDAANTIAVLLCGSIPAFADQMNARAEALRLDNTHFTNPSGLDNTAHYTSALDLARLGAAAMKNPDFKRIVSTYKIRIPYDGLQNGRLLVNHNALLKLYDGAIGIKTGFTKKSGRCLVSCAERGGVTLVAATLHGGDDWNDHMALLGGAFASMGRYSLLPVCPELTANIAGGTADDVRLDYRTDMMASLKSDEVARVKMEVTLRRFTYAPIQKGQKLGTLSFALDGVTLGETELRAANDVAQEKPSKWREFWISIFH